MKLLGCKGCETLLQRVLILGRLNNFQHASGNVVYDSVKVKTPLFHGVNDGGVHPQDIQASQDVQLAQPQAPRFLVKAIKFINVLHSQLSHRL